VPLIQGWASDHGDGKYAALIVLLTGLIMSAEKYLSVVKPVTPTAPPA
jgi:hypothetical protein